MDTRKRTSKGALLLWLGILVAAGALSPPASFAMPNFARQYGVECTHCHTMIPRLTPTGFEFRRTGFRYLREIGKERKFEKQRMTPMFIGSNYMDARIQFNASWSQRNHANSNGAYDPQGGTFTDSQFEFVEATLYPLTGGFLGYWATESEIAIATDETEVENAYIRYVNTLERFVEDLSWEARLGIFHPFEGYGAADRPIGLARPLIQTTGTVNANGDTNGFHPWGFDESGIEAGLTYGGSSLTGTVFNGLIENAEDPAQSPNLRKASDSPTHNNKDFQVFFNQFIGQSGAAASVLYYNGRISLSQPIVIETPEGGQSTEEGPLHRDSFDRVNIYLTYPVPVIEDVWLLGGFGWGSDHDTVSEKTAHSLGGYFEADWYINEMLGIGARYDRFDPSDKVSDNDISAATGILNIPLQNGLQFIAEYQYKDTEKGPNPSQTSNSLNGRFIYIF